jgi:RecJ-like exonuclease
LVEGLQFAREEKIQKRSFVQFFHAGEGIRDTIIGIVTNMMLNGEEVDKGLPLLGFALTENGDVKVSARASQSLVDRGLDLAAALTQAAKEVNGIGGGHNIAAGATIPKGKEEIFLQLVEQKIRVQLAL